MSAADTLAELCASIDTTSEELLIEKLDDYFRAGGTCAQDVTVGASKYPLLNWLCMKGKPQLTNAVLVRNPFKDSVDCDDRTPLQQTTAKENNLPEDIVLKITRDLLRSGADVDSSSSSVQRPLLNAIDRGFTTVVKELVRYKPSFTKYQAPFGSALWLASYRGLSTIVKLLLENDADANDDKLGALSRPDRVTPLMIASALGHFDVVELLLQANGDAKRVDAAGNSAIHLACIGGHWTILARLVGVGSDQYLKDQVSQRNSHGETPLRVALMYRRSNIIENLIGYGAVVTDLEYLIAIQQRDDISLKYLLIFGKSFAAKHSKKSRNQSFVKPSLSILRAAVLANCFPLIQIIVQEGEYDQDVIGTFVATEVHDADVKDLILNTFNDVTKSSKSMKEETIEEDERSDENSEAGQRRQRGE